MDWSEVNRVGHRTEGRDMVTKTAARTAQQAGAAAAAPLVVHFTRDERAARGRADRAEVPRASHSGFEPVAHRRDPVEVLSEQDSTRVPELVPIKYGRMLVSAFTFYRGAAALMAMDLGGTPRTGLHAQLCGDAHL